MTPSGIERELAITPYKVEVEYPRGKKIEYHFSSAMAMSKFGMELDDNRKAIHQSLTNRFKMKFIIAPEFCDVTLYRKLERRGYLIKVNGVEIKWPNEELEYSGTEVMARPLNVR